MALCQDSEGDELEGGVVVVWFICGTEADLVEG